MRRAKTTTSERASPRQPDWLLIDIELDKTWHRHRDWTAFLEQLGRHMGPTRS